MPPLKTYSTTEFNGNSRNNGNNEVVETTDNGTTIASTQFQQQQQQQHSYCNQQYPFKVCNSIIFC